MKIRLLGLSNLIWLGFFRFATHAAAESSYRSQPKL